MGRRLPWVCGGGRSQAVAEAHVPRPAVTAEAVVPAPAAVEAEPEAEPEAAAPALLKATALMTFHDQATIWRALDARVFKKPPPPPGSDEPAECDPLVGAEAAEAAAVADELGTRARSVAEGAAGYYALRRCVRGYWTYADRVNEMSASLERFAALRDRFDLDAVAADGPAARARCGARLANWPGLAFAAYDAYGHPIVSERVYDTLKYVNDPEAAPDDLLEGRALATEAFSSLKALASAAQPEQSCAVLKHVYVVDMSNVRLRMVTSLVRRRFRIIMTTLEAAYPEVCWRTYVVNAPVYLTIIWTVVKSWLHPITANKVRILGTDRAYILKTLLDDGIPPESVPECCGGPALEHSLADLYVGPAVRATPVDDAGGAAAVGAATAASKAVAVISAPRAVAKKGCRLDSSDAAAGGKLPLLGLLFVPAVALACYLLWRS